MRKMYTVKVTRTVEITTEISVLAPDEDYAWGWVEEHLDFGSYEKDFDNAQDTADINYTIHHITPL